MEVEVLPKPIDTTFLSYDTAQCLNDNSFSLDYTNSQPGSIYSWTFGDGFSGSGSSISHSYASTGKYELTLSLVDIQGCTDFYRDTLKVIPQPDNTVTGLSASYCEGDDSVTLFTSINSGTWIGTNINPITSSFKPAQLGVNSIQYAVDVNGCKDTATLTTTVYEIPVFSLGADTSICEGTSFIKSIEKGNSSVFWSTGDRDSFTNVNTSGLLWAQKTENGCSYLDSIQIQVIVEPSVNLGRDSLLCGGGTRIVDLRNDETTYTWNDGYTGGGYRSFTESGYYTLTATNKCGKDTDDLTLEFLPYVCDIFIPNAFTPNNDGRNDIFQPSGNVEIKGMQIYNRWGEKLYQSEDSATVLWDGIYKNTSVEPGQYFFVIQYIKPTDGSELFQIAKGVVYVLDRPITE